MCLLVLGHADCDGGSWAGDTAKPVTVAVNASTTLTVYYRGRRLLDAMIDHLLEEGLKDATNLLYSGCSAGGLTTYLHTDYVAERMPTTVKVSAVVAPHRSPVKGEQHACSCHTHSRVVKP